MSNLPPGYSTEMLKSYVKQFLHQQLRLTRFKPQKGRGKIFVDPEKKYLYSEDGYHDTHVEIWEFRSTAGKSKHKGIRRIEYVWEPAKKGEKVSKLKGVKWGAVSSGGSHGDVDLAGSL